jgi:hypothetical protein
MRIALIALSCNFVILAPATSPARIAAPARGG